ncbi:MAG: HDOD domain-containing protein [Syntrophobacteraceae bacterium]|nr:HDOD domain-containing protein [Syntrophobacteraceae bacterium]
MSNKQRNLHTTVTKLSGQDMPVFTATVQQIADMSINEESCISDLTLGVLKDPSLTAKVLSFANSSEYGRGARINTVSRAVIKLGFNAVKNITLSASLIETVLRGQKRERVLSEIARSLHAATQAKKMSTMVKNTSSEETFIGSLLQRLGHIAFWSFGGEQANKLERAMIERPGTQEDVLEREVLGFSLNELTIELARKWGLEASLGDALKSTVDNQTVRCIRLGHAIAKEIAERGLEGEKFILLTRATSNFLRTDEDETRSFIIENMAETAEIAKNFGIMALSKYITSNGERQPFDMELPPHINEADDILQIEVLGELMSMYRENRLNLNNFLIILVEGVSRGLGMDRVILGVVDKQRSLLTGRYGVGITSVDTERFIFQLDPREPTSISEAVKNKSVEWVGYPGRYDKYFSDEVRWRAKSEEFFIGTIQVRGRIIAAIYSDRSTSIRKLTEESFMDFRYFIKTANAILASNFQN